MEFGFYWTKQRRSRATTCSVASSVLRAMHPRQLQSGTVVCQIACIAKFLPLRDFTTTAHCIPHRILALMTLTVKRQIRLHLEEVITRV